MYELIYSHTFLTTRFPLHTYLLDDKFSAGIALSGFTKPLYTEEKGTWELDHRYILPIMQ